MSTPMENQAPKKKLKTLRKKGSRTYELVPIEEHKVRNKFDVQDGYLRHKLVEIQEQEKALGKDQRRILWRNNTEFHYEKEKNNNVRESKLKSDVQKTLLKPVVLDRKTIKDNRKDISSSIQSYSLDEKKTFYSPFSKASQETLLILKQREQEVEKRKVKIYPPHLQRNEELNGCLRISKILDLNKDFRKRVQDIRSDILKAGKQIHVDMEIHRSRMMRDTQTARENIRKILHNKDIK